MSTQRHVGMSLVYALCLMGAIFFSNIVLAGNCENWVAKAVSVQGGVEYRLADADDVDAWSAVARDDTFCQGDMVRTAPNARAALLLNNDSLLRLDQNSTVTFTDLSQKRPSTLGLVEGIAHFISRVKQSFKVVTPFVNALVEGTEFVVAINSSQQQTDVTVFEGRVIAANEQGQVPITNGQSAQAIANRVPERADRVRPRDAVQWALYYPPLLRFETVSLAGHAATAWQSRVKESVEYYRQANITEAFVRLQQIDGDTVNDARFFNYRASLALSVGRTEQAQADTKRALFLQEDNADALALRALMAVVQGETAQALTYAQQAVQADEAAAAPHLALSYVYQASFELEKAREAAQTATQLEENNALAWARLAELHLMFRELKAARLAAHKAVELDPSLARTQTVLGFAQLVRLATDEASNAFDRAIALDSAAPLPRLGKGLALIRQGELAQGRREIEIAASLDPNHALIRSYLGKAYYEEKRDHLAADQYAMAKELDPLDPTPWLYDAIRKQSNNQPIEALRDLEQSVALNDNRAVYRSRLLLDEDAAAKSASQARIYGSLGAQQLALKLGLHSLSLDATNYSAHRFLADAYAVLPRHQIARVSELLQAQLWQPLNLSPLQPQITEANLGILEGTGPSSAAYNEFNSLFVRNRFMPQLNGVVGGNGTLGGDVVISGVHDKLSYSLGHFHYESDGYRENNDQQQDIYNLFVQANFTHRTNIQAEIKTIEKDKGDLIRRFDLENFRSDFRELEERELLRIGIRHTFAPESQVIISAMSQKFDLRQSDNPLPTLSTDFAQEDDSLTGEIQHAWKHDVIQLITGMGYFESDSDSSLNSILDPGFPLPVIENETLSKKTNRYKNIYTYLQLRHSNFISWLLGLSVDKFDGEIIEKEQINPKIGLVWRPNVDSILRVAAFRVLKRDLVANQTVEPTQVAGFNQFFDEDNGTDSKRYGIGFDHKISDRVFTGLEFSQRRLDVPYLNESGSTHLAPWEESFYNGYLNYIYNASVAVKFAYQFEKLNTNENVLRDDALLLTTHSVPLDIEYFHDSGWSINGSTKFIRQKGVFREGVPIATSKNQDEFWMFDLRLSYRLPGRHGKVNFHVKNLFNEFYNYQEIDFNNPSFSPERLFLAKLSFLW